MPAAIPKPEDLQKIKNSPLPPQMEKPIQMARSRFFAEQGSIFENAMEIPVTLIKVFVATIAQQEEEIKKLKEQLSPGSTTTSPGPAAAAATTTKGNSNSNRATRRKASAKAKKIKPAPPLAARF